MKQIQPVTIWVNGQQQTANQFNLRVISDDLSTSATFYYELVNQTVTSPQEDGEDPVITNTVLANGNSSLSGQEYIDWNATPDINDEAYVLIAAKLNLTLI